MDTNPSASPAGTFFLFDEKPQSGLGLGFLDSPQNPTPPPPPCLEVLPSQASSNVDLTVEPVNVDGLTLLKGRVSTREVFGLSNSDLVPGKYEGGLKLWEGSLDLIKTLNSEMKEKNLSFTGKRVLELGCGHGLPGIFAFFQGAAAVHFQDFNAEVLQCLTIPNVNANIQQISVSSTEKCVSEAELRYFAGDWSEVHRILPQTLSDENGINECQTVNNTAGYDIVLMAETVYSISALPSLYKLIKKCTCSPHGVVYVAAKKHYFGVGGGSRRFISMVEKDGVFAAVLVAEFADGSSNVREVWKLHFR
ncbi:PREDICTED: histidine protein methyltransferase 1 homolog isoform X2 [Ipomoea nil]|uniref:histidine protein methyltransferase 1 homolog isoform X2 n=1 Tax=Ipomoea nil TaxID=35883 RepID=UPI000900C0F6|nr:PREDICTED: histidine protein methyltransferase 1 homolog isoform X2 [Ipomoea nil]